MNRLTDIVLGAAALTVVAMVLGPSWKGADLRDTMAIIAVALVAVLAVVAHFMPETFWRTEREFDPWLVGAAGVYRRMGFFRKHADLSDAGLAALMNARLDGELGRSKIRRWKAEGDLILIRQDAVRCWRPDPEEGMVALPETRWYERTIRELAAISEGALNAEGVRETWSAPNGPVTVTLEAAADGDGPAPRFHPKPGREEADLVGTLRFLNHLIGDAGRRFYLHAERDPVVICLEPGERDLLEHERGLRLEEPK